MGIVALTDLGREIVHLKDKSEMNSAAFESNTKQWTLLIEKLNFFGVIMIASKSKNLQKNQTSNCHYSVAQYMIILMLHFKPQNG
jgi:cell division protein FtsW (lipid II flippase)